MQSATDRIPESIKCDAPDLRSAFNEARVRHGAKAICDLAGWENESTITQIATGAMKMQIVFKIQAAAVGLSTVFGDNTVADCFSGHRYRNMLRIGGRANGSLDDEIGEITEALGSLRDKYASGRATRFEMLELRNRLQEQLSQLESEIDRVTLADSQLAIFA